MSKLGPNLRKLISPHDFRRLGYLQEGNRRFLHPLGLALEFCVEENGETTITGIWDYREGPEGIIFDEGVELGPHHAKVQAEIDRRVARREVALGYWIQPVK